MAEEKRFEPQYGFGRLSLDMSVSPERRVFRVKFSDRFMLSTTGGAWSMFEGVVAPGFGPPLHLHFCQEEWFQIMQGEFIFEAGGSHRISP